MRRLVVALGVILALVGYAALDIYDYAPGVLTLAPAPDPSPSGPTPRATVTPVALPRAAPAGMPLSASGAQAPLPTTAGVKTALGAVIEDERLGSSISVAVRDAATGAHLLDIGADDPKIPASSLKLLSAAAVNSAFPAGARLTTKVVQGATPDQVVLVAGGDTLLNPGAADPAAISGRASLQDLVAGTAKGLRAKGLTRAKVAIDLSYAPGPLLASTWLPGFRPEGITGAVAAIGLSTQRVTPGHPGPADPAASVMDAFLTGLRGRGLDVAAVDHPLTAPAGAAVLASVTSAPVADQLALAMVDSDDALTESLTRQAAFLKGTPPGFAETGGFIRATLAALGVDVSGVKILDASGLSRGNAVPARVVADVLALGTTATLPGMRETVRHLAIGGLNGTLSDRFVTSPSHVAAGVVRAKTGTLTGVSALAGTVVTARGRLLTFTVIANGVTPGVGTLDAREALDGFVTTLAGCGCR